MLTALWRLRVRRATRANQVDRLRHENRSLKAALEASMQTTAAMAADAREDARQALRKVERMSESDGGWRESFAALRSSVEAFQRGTAPVHDQMARLQSGLESLGRDLTARFTSLGEERQARRSHVDAVVDGLRARFTDTEDSLERLRRELQLCDRRRLEDMELVEAAVASVQESHRRLKDSAGNTMKQIGAEVRRLAAHARRTESDLAVVRTSAADAHTAVIAVDREATQRFDSVGDVLKALTNAAAAGAAADEAPLRLLPDGLPLPSRMSLYGSGAAHAASSAPGAGHASAAHAVHVHSSHQHLQSGRATGMSAPEAPAGDGYLTMRHG